MTPPIARPTRSGTTISKQSRAALRQCLRASAALVLALAAACSGDGGPSGQDPHPVPTMVYVSPIGAWRGSAEATVNVWGTNFVQQSVVRFNGADRPTEFVNATQLHAHLSAADLAAAGIAQITVFTPAPGGGTSGAEEFVVANPVPEFTALSANSAVVGAPGATVTITGANFFPETTVWGPRGNWQVTYVSRTELRVALTADDLKETGTLLLWISNPEPGGGSTSTSAIQVVNPVPTITALTPTFVATLTPATVTVLGTGFTRFSRIHVRGELPMPTFVSATEMRFSLPAEQLGSSGTLEVQVENLGPGGGTSNKATLEVRSGVPVVTSLLDSSTTASGQESFDIYVNGSGFVDNSQVFFNGTARPTQTNNSGQVKATLNAADLSTPGTYPVRVVNPAPGGGTSNSVDFTVRAWPSTPATTRSR